MSSDLKTIYFSQPEMRIKAGGYKRDENSQVMAAGLYVPAVVFPCHSQVDIAVGTHQYRPFSSVILLPTAPGRKEQE